MQAKRHTLISMASPAYNAQMAISINWQYFLSSLVLPHNCPQGILPGQGGCSQCLSAEPHNITAKGSKNSHANSKHLIMVCVKWSLFMPMTTNGKSAKSPVVIITCPTKDSKANKAEK
jgi:hypothetical protein